MVALLAWSHAIAWVVSAERPLLSPAFERFGFIKVGHDNIVVDPTIRRYTGMVAALGTPGNDGKLYSFTTAPMGPRSFALSPNDLRGWRMTMLSGKRFSQVFTVACNTQSVITVSADKGPLDGIAERDVFIIESIDKNGISMFAPPGAQPVPPGL
jgi:hypothetical protein